MINGFDSARPLPSASFSHFQKKKKEKKRAGSMGRGGACVRARVYIFFPCTVSPRLARPRELCQYFLVCIVILGCSSTAMRCQGKSYKYKYTEASVAIPKVNDLGIGEWISPCADATPRARAKPFRVRYKWALNIQLNRCDCWLGFFFSEFSYQFAMLGRTVRWANKWFLFDFSRKF